MQRRTFVGWLVAALVLTHARSAVPSDDPRLLRLFLTDGTALTSYGEPARIGDRVIFSMPTAVAPNPPLHLVNLPADRVDWDRTNRYAETVHAARYAAAHGEFDYAALTNRMTLALGELVIAENARKMLVAWPRDHYNYRLAEVRQMLSLLDEAIADLRAIVGDGRFDLSLTAFTDPPSVATEQLGAPPTPKDAIEQIVYTVKIADSAAERTALLETALGSLNRDAAVLPPASLETIKSIVLEILSKTRAVTPPDEFQSAHALLVSAAQLARNAAQIREEAALAVDVARAWNASSASAGALMLSARARTDMQTLLRSPQLR